MIKVLFMIPNLGQGGAEKVLVNLVNNIDKSKFDVTLKTLFDVGVNKQFLNNDVKYEYCFKKVFKANSQILKLFPYKLLYRIFIKEKYDLVVSYLEGPTARIISGCHDNNTKKVCWIHCEQHNKINASYSFRNFKEAKKCYNSFDKIVCVSNTVKEDFQRIFELNTSYEVLYNVNETQQIIDKSEEETIELDNETIKICGVGRLTEVKRFDRLVRIHERLKKDGFKVHTYLLGEGKERDNLEKYVTSNNLESSFTFLGYQINPYKYVKQMDIFVCSSITEGFNTAATEALILGVPVVSTLVSGMKEMLGMNNEYGIVTDNDEEALYKGIKQLLDSPELLDVYKEQASKRGKMFSTEKTVQAVEKMLLSL